MAVEKGQGQCFTKKLKKTVPETNCANATVCSPHAPAVLLSAFGAVPEWCGTTNQAVMMGFVCSLEADPSLNSTFSSYVQPCGISDPISVLRFDWLLEALLSTVC